VLPGQQAVPVLGFGSSHLACEKAAHDYTAGVLSDEQTSSEQIAVFRRMTPEQRWHAARRLYWTMRWH